mmetsp:Transcript_15392/g.25702  ORF Transcript_15392/g.25702 Transcript_15392/m.25702 type:complete len:82 (-) Transcript_15392:1351-1596(-)
MPHRDPSPHLVCSLKVHTAYVAALSATPSTGGIPVRMAVVLTDATSALGETSINFMWPSFNAAKVHGRRNYGRVQTYEPRI